MTEFIDTSHVYDMTVIKGTLRPWTAPNGSVRYYINNVLDLISSKRDYYDWDEMRASGGRVFNRIIENIIPNTKVYIDSDGLLHITGWATVGKGESMDLPNIIASRVWDAYGPATPEIKTRRADALIGRSGVYADVGDVVEIIKGRKNVGGTFTISTVKYYRYSDYARPTVTLYDGEFHVNADNCIIVGVGNSRDMSQL